MAPRSSSWLFRAFAVLVGVGVAVGLVVGAEYAARVLDPLTPEEQTNADAFDYQAWTLGPCYRSSFGRLVPVRPQTELRHPGADASETFSTSKPAGVRRIVVVGESTGEMLERKLVELTKGCRGQVEVLRCSAAGSRPFIAVRRVEEALAWSPDVIVVAIGHNFMLPGPPSLAQLDINRSRLIHAVHKWFPSREPPPPPPPPAPKTGAVELDDMDPPSMGREAYKRILDLTRAKGVQVVGLVLSSNLWYRPNAEPGYAGSNERAKAWAQWSQGDLSGAIATLNSAEGAMKAYERARLQTEAGTWADAKHDLERARDLEAMPTRASTAVTTGIREAATAGGARVIDVEALFAPLADHGIPGWDIYFDNCHPNPGPLDQLARTVLAASAPQGAPACLSTPPPPDPTASADAFSRLTQGPASVLLPDAAADAETVRRRVDGPFTTLLRGQAAEAMALFQRYDREVLAKTPPPLHANVLTALAETARDNGRIDLARWCLDQSIGVTPTALALLDRAMLELREHQIPEARGDVERALTLEPASALGRELKALTGN